MAQQDSSMDRRSFIKTGALLGGAAATLQAGQAAAVPTKKTIKSIGTLPEVTFGRTGDMLPVFGHGGSAMMASDIDKYGLELISLEERIKMVRKGYDEGIRFFDTARIYGESEGIMASALSDVRDNIFLASKAMVKTPEEVRESVETSLKTLKTDYVDSMSIHGPMVERLPFDNLMEQYAVMDKMRDEGKIRFIGLTGHSRFEKMYELIDTGKFDTVLIEAGYIRKGYNTNHSNTQLEFQELCIARAHELNMGIVAMKVMGANVFGHNSKNLIPDYDAERRDQLPGAAIRWVLNDERIHILNIGISLPEDIDRNMEIFKADTTLKPEDRLLLADFASKAYEQPAISEQRTV